MDGEISGLYNGSVGRVMGQMIGRWKGEVVRVGLIMTDCAIGWVKRYVDDMLKDLVTG